MKKGAGETYTHHNHLSPHGKTLFEEFWGVQEARKDEDLGPHILAPETRTNLCSYAQRILKIG